MSDPSGETTWKFAIYLVDHDGSSQATFAFDHVFSKYRPAEGGSRLPQPSDEGVRVVALTCADLEETADSKKGKGGAAGGLANSLLSIVKEDEKAGLVAKAQGVSFEKSEDAEDGVLELDLRPGNPGDAFPDVIYLLRDFPSNSDDTDQVCTCLPACLPACLPDCLPACLPACNPCLCVAL